MRMKIQEELKFVVRRFLVRYNIISCRHWGSPALPVGMRTLKFFCLYCKKTITILDSFKTIFESGFTKIYEQGLQDHKALDKAMKADDLYKECGGGLCRNTVIKLR